MSMWHEKSNIVTAITGKKKEEKKENTQNWNYNTKIELQWIVEGEETWEITFIDVRKHYRDFQ